MIHTVGVGTIRSRPPVRKEGKVVHCHRRRIEDPVEVPVILVPRLVPVVAGVGSEWRLRIRPRTTPIGGCVGADDFL